MKKEERFGHLTTSAHVVLGTGETFLTASTTSRGTERKEGKGRKKKQEKKEGRGRKERKTEGKRTASKERKKKGKERKRKEKKGKEKKGREEMGGGSWRAGLPYRKVKREKVGEGEKK